MRKIVLTGTLVALLASSSALQTLGAEPPSAAESFRAAGSLTDPRQEHTATLLPDGGVLIVGGYGYEGTLASAEMWDPVSETFSPAGSLAEARAAHTATLLSDGHVLIVGGYGDEGTLASAELWDPDSRTFAGAGSLAEARNSHTATLLPDGNVLIVGGLTNDLANLPTSAESWDPVSGTFGAAGWLAEGRAGHTATLTSDGGVLVVGGIDLPGNKRDSAELWVPSFTNFLPAGTLSEARGGHTATLTSDGGVLVVGGAGVEAALTSAEKWDPGSGSFSPAGSLEETRIVHTATLVPDGRVLVVGGADVLDIRASAEAWDPASGTFSPAGTLSERRAWHTATSLPSGGVLVVGGLGDDGSPTPSAELWEPGAGQSAEPGASTGIDPALALVELLNMPPAGIMETCSPGDPSMAGQVAVIQCSFGTDVVVYASWEDASSLAAAYEGIASQAGVVGGTSCKDGPFEGPYLAADGTAGGRVVCQVTPDGPLLGWTDDRNLVLGFLLLVGEGGLAALHDHWLQVRLDAPAIAAASPSPAMASTEPVVPGAEVRQWAVSATASSEYSTTSWSAQQATGSPDAPQYGGHTESWAPLSDPGEPEWLELTYATPVVPTEVHIWEGNGAGFVVQVEAWDEATDEWVTLWQGTDPTPAELMAFSPPLVETNVATRRIRLTAGPGADGYPYVDAVELVGTAPRE